MALSCLGLFADLVLTSPDVVTLQAGADFHHASPQTPCTACKPTISIRSQHVPGDKCKPNLEREGLHIKRLVSFVLTVLGGSGVWVGSLQH